MFLNNGTIIPLKDSLCLKGVGSFLLSINSNLCSQEIVAKRMTGYSYIYPFIEFSLGNLFLIPAHHLITDLIILKAVIVGVIGVIQSMLRKSKFQSAYVGAVFELPLSKIKLFEDVLMILMSASSLILN